MTPKILAPLLLAAGFLLHGCASSSPPLETAQLETAQPETVQPEPLPRFIEIFSKPSGIPRRDSKGNMHPPSKWAPRRWVQLSEVSMIEEMRDGRARLRWNADGAQSGVAKHYTALQLAGALQEASPPSDATTTAEAP